MRPGRLTAGLIAGSALALVPATAVALAQVERHQVTVIRAAGVRLVAWDSASAKKGLCFRLKSGSQSNAACDRSGKHRLRLAYTSFVSGNGSATFVGGVARRGEETVVATFANGQTLSLHTVRGARYRGRQRGRARFWAGRQAGGGALTSLVAKDFRGRQAEGIIVGPAPTPVPPPTPCPPCGGPPRQSQSIVCPLRPCPA